MFAAFIKTIWRRFAVWGARVGWVKVGISGAVIVVAGLLGIHFLTRSAATPATPAEVSHVQVESVSNLSQETGPLVVTGKVTSLNQATILAQTSGQIVSLSKKIGDYVSAGDSIAEFENSSQLAAVAQAKGALAAAQANLAGVEGPTGSSAKAGAVNALLSAYAAVDSATRGTADTMISNPDSVNPQFVISTSNAQLPVTIDGERLTLASTLSREGANAKTISTNDNLDAEITTTLGEVRSARAFLDNIIQALNSAIPSQSVSQTQIATDLAAATAARTSLTSALSALSSAQATLENGGSGSGSPNVAAAQAQVAEAQGALAAAQANLDKTIVRSPISGVVVSLPINQGDYISQNAQVAEVSNPGALEIDTAVTPDDAKTLAVGGKATIETDTLGTIISISPALDPTTNKIPLKIGIVGSQSNLTDGQTVSVSLSRAITPAPKKNPSSAILIPIIAAKITPEGPVVFTVSTSSTLVSHPITLGTILGAQVTVLTGLTPDMTVVTDARGLSEGQTVVVDLQ